MHDHFINGRFLHQIQSGVQRYGRGVLLELQLPQEQVLRPQSTSRFAGIRWEQFELPKTLKDQGEPLLLNFCNTAPITYDRQIVTIHDLSAIEHPTWFRRSFAVYYQRLLPVISRKARHVVTVSHHSKQRLMEVLGLPEEKITVIAPGVDTHLLNTPPSPLETSHGPFVLMVGSLDPRKRFDQAAEVLIPTLEKLGLTLIVVGRSSTNFGKVTLPHHPRVRWIEGPSDAQLNWLYRTAELVIHPSAYEGFNLIPLESLHLGTPVLLSDIPVHKEVYEGYAHFFAADNMSALPRHLQLALNATSKTDIPRQYSYARAAQEWLDLAHRF